MNSTNSQTIADLIITIARLHEAAQNAEDREQHGRASQHRATAARYESELRTARAAEVQA